ncbi:MAG: lmo0937 family membrane protein [Sulfuricurvum sp.]|nr:lmo0937 family membrane protein [Sulfuricurvum sp.]MDP3119468.1 lmo0937 family membrane protein [Sulfuricurvum sp.]
MTRNTIAADIGLYPLRYAYNGKEEKMLETIALVLIILWMLGFVTSYTMGGFIHILLVIAIVVLLVRIIQGRRL